MSRRENYQPGPAVATLGQKDGDSWSLVLVKELRHSPENVWQALTEPGQLREWAPFDADGNMGTVGSVHLTTVGSPSPHVTESIISRADAPHVLEYTWGGKEMRWELQALGGGTRLTLWASIDRRFISMGAAGWQLCLDVLDAYLDEDPIGRMVAGDALAFDGWHRLNAEYAEKFGVELPRW